MKKNLGPIVVAAIILALASFVVVGCSKEQAQESESAGAPESTPQSPQASATEAIPARYLNQKTPGMVPEVFAPGIISTEACELAGVFSPDGREYFFIRRGTMEGNDNRLLGTREIEGQWTAPQLPSFAQDCNELFPTVSADGRTVYFLSERAHPATGKMMTNDEKIWYAEKTEAGWGEASLLDGPLNEGWLLAVAAGPDGALYVAGEFGDKGGVFRSAPVNGRFETYEYVLDGVHPCLAPDGSYMVFDRFANEGSTALFVAFREASGQWGAAKPLGPEVNATGTEVFGTISPDGKYLFFYREGEIYWVDAELVTGMAAK